MTKESHPILSFCIPTYNNVNELEATLESMIPQVLQSKERIEIVISDNCSQDGTRDLVKKYMTSYPFITYDRNLENLGPGRNIFKTIEMASGELVWLMGDDELLPGALEHVLDALSRVGKPYPSETYVNWIHQWPESYRGNRTKLESQANAKVKEDIQLSDIESYLRLRAPYFPYLSAHILDRTLIDLVALRPFADSRWFQVYVVMLNLHKNPKSLHIAKPCVLDRPGNPQKPRVIPPDPWPGKIYTQITNVFHDMVEMGVIKEAIAREIISEIYGYIFCDRTPLSSLLHNKLKAFSKGPEQEAYRMIYRATLASASPMHRCLAQASPIWLLWLGFKLHPRARSRRVIAKIKDGCRTSSALICRL